MDPDNRRADQGFCEKGLKSIRTLAGLGRLELRDGTVHLLKEGSLLLINKSRILNYAADSKGWQFY